METRRYIMVGRWSWLPIGSFGFKEHPIISQSPHLFRVQIFSYRLPFSIQMRLESLDICFIYLCIQERQLFRRVLHLRTYFCLTVMIYQLILLIWLWEVGVLAVMCLFITKVKEPSTHLIYKACLWFVTSNKRESSIPNAPLASKLQIKYNDIRSLKLFLWG